MKIFIILLIFMISGCITDSVNTGTYYLINERITQLEEKIQKIEIQYVSTSIVEVEKKIKREIWLRMKNGSNKKIIFTFDDGYWIGSKNEYYDSFPSDKEIKLLYYE